MFDRYIITKTELKDSTRNNYKYMYEHYIREQFGQKKLASVKYSDVKAFYTSLIKDKGFKPNSMEVIQYYIQHLLLQCVMIIFARIRQTELWQK